MRGPHKLFVYGTLADQEYFQLITGKNLPRRVATLCGFQRIEEADAFPYIIPSPGDTVEGMLLEGVGPEAMARLDQYEANGWLYHRQAVMVNVEGVQIGADVYVGDPIAIAEHFRLGRAQGERVGADLEREIDQALARMAGGSEGEPSDLELRARRELMGDAIAEIRHCYFHSPGWTPHIVRYSLGRATPPRLTWLRGDAEAQAYAGHYLRLINRVVVFNQTEESVRRDFRRAVRIDEPYYERAISTLIALAFLNARAATLDDALHRAGLDTYDPNREYLDHTREALLLADALYDRDAVAAIVRRVAEHRQPGGIPMGAELEFAHRGARAIGARPGADPHFDSFHYFHDFNLAGRLWKLGGYMDDHTGITYDESRSRGFLEIAFGRLRGEGDYSRPATNDPWLLSELIRQATTFIGVAPHSLHLSFQADPERPFTRLENPRSLLCLLLLGGDLRPNRAGQLQELRIAQKEITNRQTGLVFSRLNSHRASESQGTATPVVEFTFPRLFAHRSYEALILALKGFQLAGNPMPLDFSPKCPHRRYHRQIESELTRWAQNPQPLGEEEIGAFVAEVERGLEQERLAGRGHSPRYIAAALTRIERILKARNRQVRESVPPPA